MPIVLIVILVVVAIVLLAINSAARNRERLAAVAGWAAANSFQFSEDDPFNLDGRFNGIGSIGQGHARRAFEVLNRPDPVPTWIFRYEYRTWETRTVTDSEGRSHTETYEETHHCSFLIIELQSQFPRLFIRPENLFDKVKAMAGFDDINFESEEFSRRYYCKSNDRAFASAVIHPQMMEWMLSLRAANMRFEGQLEGPLFVSHTDKLPNTPEGHQAALAMAVGFINRLPRFVWEDYGKREPVKLQEPISPPRAQVSARA